MLHIDIETRSSVDLKACGLYKYAESDDFEILLLAYAIGNNPVQLIDLANGDEIPEELDHYIQHTDRPLAAHNATFERICLRSLGYDIAPGRWHCTAIMAARCGLPMSLKNAAKALNLDAQKDAAGTRLINFFSKPQKDGTFRPPSADTDKWEEFGRYCVQDVVVEAAIYRRLRKYKTTEFERKLYNLDQRINDNGVMVDLDFSEKVQNLYSQHSTELKLRAKQITGLDNPNSLAQLSEWLSTQGLTEKDIPNLRAATVDALLDKLPAGPVREVLDIRRRLSKASVKKYKRMTQMACADGRVHGFLQFYGASRTGRWAGRGLQPQNLPRNYVEPLDHVRQDVLELDLEELKMLYGDVSDTLSQLTRTCLTAPEGHVFVVADFSAIEARVIAWLAGEKWRLNIFADHGKIYEASASMMFGVPIEQITKGSDLRARGKVAELALGYQGSVGAMKAMGAEKMGLSEDEIRDIVYAWRDASPNIVKFWHMLEKAAVASIQGCRRIKLKRYHGITFDTDKDREYLTIELPSGRKLYYARPELVFGRFSPNTITYHGTQGSSGWGPVETYGGKLAENITQAVARDALAEAMVTVADAGYKIVMHVHDEIIVEVPYGSGDGSLVDLCRLMNRPIEWASGLPLNSDGYVTQYYKKD